LTESILPRLFKDLLMKVTITCEDCGRKHRLERDVQEAGEIWIMCHNCEVPLVSILESDQFKGNPGGATQKTRRPVPTIAKDTTPAPSFYEFIDDGGK
jgi:hypothetical protein